MASLSDLLSALQNGVVAVNNLNTTLGNVFPGATTVSTTAPSSAGSITFTSSETKGFISVISSSGATYRVALY
jgi:hypothetical protein